MSKRISITRPDVEGHRASLLASAETTQIRLAELAGSESPMAFLYLLKFRAVGCDPLDPSRPLNLIEQLNQTFTYLASFSAAAFLFEQHPKVQSLSLNLGTTSGFDVETPEDGGIAAEVFAAVTPTNNRKLAKDIERVSMSTARHRYVLFISPEHDPGLYRDATKVSGVTVWSLGCSL